jgi:uncharacterized protein involved in exopolysaccharide biosynthesis
VTGLPVRVLLVLVLGAVAGAAALAYSDSQPKTYTASMRFGFVRTVSPDLQVLGGSFSQPQGDENIRTQTEAIGMNSFDVATATANAFPSLGYNAAQVHSHVFASPVRDTLTVTLGARAESPARAARLAAAYGQEYLRLQQQGIRSRSAVTERALKVELATLPRVQRVGLQGATLRNQINTLSVLNRVGTGEPQVLERAHASSVAASPNTTRNVGFGVLFGLVVGIGMVALRSEGRSRSAAAERLPDRPVR